MKTRILEVVLHVPYAPAACWGTLLLLQACATTSPAVLASRSAPLVGCHDQEVITQNERHKCTQGRLHSWEAICNGQVYYCSNLGNLNEVPDTDATVGSHMHAVVREDLSNDVCSAMATEISCPKVADVDAPGGIPNATRPDLLQTYGSPMPNMGGGR
jgi:hypothetical protein